MATRETCKCCGRENAVGFSVPDDVWTAAVPQEYCNRVLCITCFDRFATLRGIDWTTTPVQFWPWSGAGFATATGQTCEEVAARTRPVARQSLLDELQQARERISVLEEALKPFAEAGKDVAFLDHIVAFKCITYGDLRRARLCLQRCSGNRGVGASDTTDPRLQRSLEGW